MKRPIHPFRTQEKVTSSASTQLQITINKVYMTNMVLGPEATIVGEKPMIKYDARAANQHKATMPPCALWEKLRNRAPPTQHT